MSVIDGNGAKCFVELVANNPTSALYSQMRVQLGGDDGVKSALHDVLKDAIPNLYAHNVTESGGNVESATTKLKDQLEKIETSKVVGADANAIKDGLTVLSKASQKGDFKALEELGNGGLGSAFKGAGVVIGIAKAANGGQDPTAYVQTLASTGKEGCELIAAATKSLSGTFPSVEHRDCASREERRVARGDLGGRRAELPRSARRALRYRAKEVSSYSGTSRRVRPES